MIDLIGLVIALSIFSALILGILIGVHMPLSREEEKDVLQNLRDLNKNMSGMLKEFKLIREALDRLAAGEPPVMPAASVEFYQLIDGQRVKVDNMFMKVEGVADLSVVFKDKNGNAAKVDGVPKWALTNEALGKLEPSEDGLSCVFSAAGDIQAGKIQVLADADLGEGQKEIIGELDIELQPLDAEFVEISAVVR